MSLGTTRQLLNDREAMRDRNSRVRVVRGDDGTVQVTVAADPVSARAAGKVLVYLPSTLGAVALLSLMLALMVGPAFWFGVLAFGWFGIVLFAVTLFEYDRSGRAHVFRVGRDVISADSAGGVFGPRHWEWKREGVRNVRLVEGKRRCVLFDLTPGWGNHVAFVLDLRREDYVTLVDALREGLNA